MPVGIVGLGVVGGAMYRGFKASGFDVFGYDIDPGRSHAPLDVVLGQDVVFISVPTPVNAEGLCDLSAIESILDRADAIGVRGLMVIRSTVPVGTTNALMAKHPALKIGYSPEFLRKCSADPDFRNPPLLVYGGAEPESCLVLMKRACTVPDESSFILSPSEAELLKLMLNGFAALKTVFASELASFASSAGANWEKVVAAAGEEGRLGGGYLSETGPDGLPGFGGSCLPKDCLMLAGQLAQGSLLEKVIQTNAKLRNPPAR